MNRRVPPILRWAAALILLLIACAVLWAGVFRPPAARTQASLISLPAAPEDTNAYAHATGPIELSFPRDHGAHPAFQTEWWYYTGNLQAADGQRFGYQLTVFRRALTPQSAVTSARASDWATNQVYMAHFTLTDVQARAFHAFERFERGAAGLAGAQGSPQYQVWLDDWSVQQTGPEKYRLRAQADGAALDLTLTDAKGIVLQGDRGYSQKGPQPGNASIYYSQTRLESQGSLTAGGKSYTVSGLSWLDREISTSALSPNQVGWDWFALQLDDGSELMAYILRRADGSIDPYSSATFIAADGTAYPLKREDFSIASSATWTSPHSGGVYPARWTVTVPGQQLTLDIQPLLADQELNLSVTYWEGAVQISGTHDGTPVSGHGYVELTGYAQSLQGVLGK